MRHLGDITPRAPRLTGPIRDRPVLLRLVLWVGLALLLALATLVGSSLDRCDPHGNLIAFLSYRSGIDGLYAVDADRGFLCRLTLADAGGSIGSNHVTWSPTGRAIAWIDDNRLLVQQLPNDAPTALTERSTGYEFPLAWSPDEKRIALITATSDGVFTLATVTVTNPPTLRDLMVIERISLDVLRASTPQARGSLIAWSPDGQRLLLDAGGQILSVAADGRAAHVIIPHGRQPAWSPDGQQIAFVQGSALMLMTADGTNQRVLARDGERPTWSPDGTWIAFRTASGLAVVAPDGTDEHVVFRGDIIPFFDSNATSYAWSPDGRRLAVLALDHATSPARQLISVVRLADGQVQRLVARGMNRALAWRPASSTSPGS